MDDILDRFGILVVHKDTLLEAYVGHPDIYKEIFGSLMIVSAQTNWERGTITYHVHCKDFPLWDKSYPVPEYTIIVTKSGDNHLTWEWDFERGREK